MVVHTDLARPADRAWAFVIDVLVHTVLNVLVSIMVIPLLLGESTTRALVKAFTANGFT